ncbi:MAG: ATP-binding protein [Acidobacteria bacterium]|nr:ATP-binding protein [Acidobacteriota bacterium]
MEPTEKQLEGLGTRADSVRKALSDEHSPIAVEFAGSPKAGKTTTIEILHHFFRRRGFKVWAPTEGASKRTPYHLKRDLVAFNAWTLNYAISELLVAYHNIDHHHLIIMDRGPFDSLAWMGLLYREEKLEKEELEIFRSFALQKRWANLIQRVYLFKCSPDVSLKREQDSKLTRGRGTAMNKVMLSALIQEYGEIEKELKEYPIQTIDTSEKTTPLSTAYELAQDLIGTFESLATVK